MGRRRTEGKNTTGVSIKLDANLVAKFLYLCRGKGTSMAEGIRRCMVDAVLQNRVPGIEDMILERDSNAVDLTHREDLMRAEKARQRSNGEDPTSLASAPVFVPVPAASKQKNSTPTAPTKSQSKRSLSASHD